MEIIRSIKIMQVRSRGLAAKGKKIALVPTMGYLHDGHLTLVKKAKKLSDIVITSIFVNPAQFAPNEDFSRYPRDEKGDIAKIKKAGGDIVFMPRVSEMYPDDFQTYITIEEITKTLEGAIRPSHFRGVTTIVGKVFNITRPDLAVFGMKDYQQVMVLSRMLRELNYPIKMIIAPTVREKDGLAMSSRNKYFAPGQREEAVCLYQALKVAQIMVAEGNDDPIIVRPKMEQVILDICPPAEIDYIAFTDFETLKPVERIEKNCICSLAVRLYGVRLIDNMKLK